MTEGIELPNQNKIRTPEEKETFWYLRILKADTIKRGEMKLKKIKRVSQENKKTTWYQTIHQKSHRVYKTLGLSPL